MGIRVILKTRFKSPAILPLSLYIVDKLILYAVRTLLTIIIMTWAPVKSHKSKIGGNWHVIRMPE